LGYPLLVSVSRKSFLGSITGRSVHERGAASLAAELFAAEQGVEWIRTHDPMALVDGLRIATALRTVGRTLA
jgi:dihydropteroate synthase